MTTVTIIHDPTVERVREAITKAWDECGEVPFPLYEDEGRKLARAAIGVIVASLKEHALATPEAAAAPRARAARPYPNADSARLAGFTVDDHCYPWVAYKGPRFRPDEWHCVDTDDEALLRGVAGGAMDVIHTVLVVLRERGKLTPFGEAAHFLRAAVMRMKRALGREPSIIDQFPGGTR